jgi:hypothetical protein
MWDQKRRFGFDFLYPTQRYVNALTQGLICPSRTDLDPTQCPDANGDGQRDTVPNPLFQGTPTRDPSLVFLAGIVGVPWQDIATDTDPTKPLHFKTALQMQDPTDSTWSMILGDPSPPNDGAPIAPTDQLMIESWLPRTGNDGQGNALIQPTNAPVPTPNSVATTMPNGHEWGDVSKNDLEYACIFPLPQTSDCGSPSVTRHCDCGLTKLGDNNPLCQNADGSYGKIQSFAKAYPGLRELKVLKDFGKNSIIASICSRNTNPANKTAQDYGYNAAVDAIVERLKEALTNKCLPLTLTPVPDPDHPGQSKTPCTVIEASLMTAAGQQCDPSKKRSPADPRVIGPAQDQLRNEGVCDGTSGHPCSNFLFCAIEETTNEPYNDKCHQKTPTLNQGEIGWCYVDPQADATANPSFVAGDQAIVSKCPADQQRVLNFIDPNAKTPAPGATVLIACFGAQSDTPPSVTPVQTGSGGGTAASTDGG